MKRVGTFCDTPNCSNPAIGPCVCCDKDVCDKHGHPAALQIKILRAVEGTTSAAQMAEGGSIACYACVHRIGDSLFIHEILPDLLGRVGEMTKAALVSRALKDESR